MSFKYEVSVIVPVYNVEQYLQKCLDSLVDQTISKEKMEVILVDDGSSDSSPAICDEYVEKHSFMKVFHIENGGVSSARNFGIDKAQGKYIMYLDSDDYLSKGSVKSLVNFFDAHYDEIDLVTYNEVHDKDGVIKRNTHFRTRFINKTGVYDLNDKDYRYFVQTHMNICVKNKGKDNAKFDTTMIFHEDQKYIISILEDKQKIGFCDKADYFYLQNAGGASGSYGHPYYIFEKTMQLWEDFFNKPYVPEYIQAYFLNDFRWKLKADILWPYQYKGEEYERQAGRIVNLLKKVDDEVILDYGALIKPHKAFVFELKYGKELKLVTEDDRYVICHNDNELLECENIDIYITRFNIKNNKLTMIGVEKCLAGNLTDDIKIEAEYSYKNGDKKKETLPLRDSSLSICASQTRTNNFKMFVIKTDIKNLKKISFKAYLNGKTYPVKFSQGVTSPFNAELKRMKYICEGKTISCTGSKIKFRKTELSDMASVFFRNIRFAPKIGYRNTLTRFMAPRHKKKNKIWLYCDSSKTVKDNGYYQFLHDVKKDDGIKRYYVYNPETDIDGWFDDSMKNNLVPYGSVTHRLYALSADKIITSFYGLRDMLSYPYGAHKYFADIINFDVIYLQHGVLHANLPTMYSLDRMLLDKEVISTKFEFESLQKNYCFDESFLITSGMPRYNHIDTTQKAEKKILFAPSWRKFLVLSDGKGSWKPNEKAFLNSDFYKNTMEFLNNPKLHKVLEEHDFVLDFKPHPNFRMYDEFFKFDSDRVRLAEKTVDEFSYSIFITDFSSFVFDFVYLKRPVLYFVPDIELFEAGLNHYRKLDIPFEEAFGDFSTTGEETVDNVISLIENNCVPEEKYVQRMEGLFFDVDDHEEALYQELIKE